MKIGVLTSGGDAPGMNAAIRAVVRTALHYGHEVYGIYDGYRGLVGGQMEPFNRKSVSETLSRGGTILGTARLPEFHQRETQDLAIAQLNARGIEALVVIGGDGSYRGARDLTKLGVKCIGLPGTIDNDIHKTNYTIGFATAVETIVDAVDKLRDTSSSHQRCSIIETMGRDCGDLALYAGICGGAEYIITKETGFDKAAMLKSLRKNRDEGRRHAIVVISEKIANVHELAKEVEAYSGYETRATVLGYTQRGGQPCPEDRILASRMGSYAIDLLHQGIYGVAVGVENNQMMHATFDEVFEAEEPKNSLYELVDKIS